MEIKNLKWEKVGNVGWDVYIDGEIVERIADMSELGRVLIAFEETPTMIEKLYAAGFRLSRLKGLVTEGIRTGAKELELIGTLIADCIAEIKSGERDENGIPR